MSFPSNFSDDGLGELHSFQNLDNDDVDFDKLLSQNPSFSDSGLDDEQRNPVTMSEVIGLNERSTSGPVSTSAHHESEQNPVGLKARNSNASLQESSKATESDAHGLSISANLDTQLDPNSQKSTIANENHAMKSTELGVDVFNGSSQRAEDQQYDEHLMAGSNTLQPQPSIPHENPPEFASDSFDLNNWNAIENPTQVSPSFHHAEAHSIQIGSNAELSGFSRSIQDPSTAESEPFDFNSWNTTNNPNHAQGFPGDEEIQQRTFNTSNGETDRLFGHASVAGQPSYHSSPEAQRVGLNVTNQGLQMGNAMSPMLATSDDENAHSPASTELSSSMSPHSSHGHGHRRHSSSGPYQYQQSSPPLSMQRQKQQVRRPPSNLRHMSIPDQSEIIYSSSPNMQAKQYSHETGIPFNAASPFMARRQHLQMTMNEAQSSIGGGCGDNLMLTRYMAGDTQGVFDFRSHSPVSDAQASQHFLGNSPGSGRGHHNIMTPNMSQSPRQPALLTQPLALQHLAPLSSRYQLPSQQEIYHKMKSENSSPESAGAALRKVKREAQSAGSRRGSHGSSSQSSAMDPEDEKLINHMYDAMMDMSHAEDNEGMIKTWTGLMKEKRRVKEVCGELLRVCYKLEGNGGPLQNAIKTQNTYDNINHRVYELCQAFKAQKTMCKHLMESPYIYQVVDDPILAANRVVNNRKVNRGKKQAIEAGREALKAAGGSNAGDDAQDEDDADGEDDDEYERAASSMSPNINRANASNKRVRKSVPPNGRAGSEDVQRSTYGENTAKKAKRPSNSRYQMTPDGGMIDLGVAPRMVRTSPAVSRPHSRNRSLSAHPQAGAASEIPMVIDQRANTGHAVRNDAAAHHGQHGIPRSGSFTLGLSGNLSSSHFGGGQQGRR